MRHVPSGSPGCLLAMEAMRSLGSSRETPAHANPWPSPVLVGLRPMKDPGMGCCAPHLEKIDLICHMCASYSELELVTSMKGKGTDGGMLGTCLSYPSP